MLYQDSRVDSQSAILDEGRFSVADGISNSSFNPKQNGGKDKINTMQAAHLLKMISTDVNMTYSN